MVPKKMNHIPIKTSLLVLIFAASSGVAQGAGTTDSKSPGDTAGSRDSFTATGYSARDEDLTRRLREELMKDNSLSADAKNVRISASDGGMKLEGTVQNQSEAAKVLRMAQNVAGGSTVRNELEIRKR